MLNIKSGKKLQSNPGIYHILLLLRISELSVFRNNSYKSHSTVEIEWNETIENMRFIYT